ncbi:hypothetical protein OAY23_01920 [bacterium]|nr:hypothetical protein [bacterium]
MSMTYFMGIRGKLNAAVRSTLHIKLVLPNITAPDFARYGFPCCCSFSHSTECFGNSFYASANRSAM